MTVELSQSVSNMISTKSEQKFGVHDASTIASYISESPAYSSLMDKQRNLEDAELFTVSLHVYHSWMSADQNPRKCSHSESVLIKSIWVR